MRPHPRIRKTIKWGGAAVTVLMVVVWFGSGWYRIDWQSKNPTAYGLGGGELSLVLPDARASQRPSARAPGWRSWRTTPDWRVYWFQHREVSLPTGSVNIYIVPVWVLAFTCGLATAAAWWFDALAHIRARLNLCPKCSYNRAGIAGDAKCPECGAARGRLSSTSTTSTPARPEP